jgi:uroporphyrinogen decarboxylase
MSQWNSKSRFEAVLNSEVPDRAPVAAWGHFFDVETNPALLADATIRFTLSYDWDWVKINPRNTYYLEAFGSTFDYDDYHGSQPYQTRGVINTVKDLSLVDHERAIGSKAILDQIEVLRRVRSSLPDRPVAQTVFSPLTILLGLAGLPRSVGKTIPGSTTRVTLADLVGQNPIGTHHALEEITLVLEDYIAKIAETGADAVYYALTGTANPVISGRQVFEEFSTPYDRRIIAAITDHGLPTLLHTCGPHAFADVISSYDVAAISWDHFDSGNPGIGTPSAIPALAGINRADITKGDVDAVRRQARRALDIYQDKPFLLAPTCSTLTRLRNPALSALRAAVDEPLPVTR